MKIIRIVYITWNNIDMRCTLEYEESCSNIDIDIMAVHWSMTGRESCGCIVHEHLPAYINTKIEHGKTTLAFDSVSLRHIPFSGIRKKQKERMGKYIVGDCG